MKPRTCLACILFASVLRPGLSLAEPAISIDPVSRVVRIEANGESSAQVLDALASKAGFSLSGKLENTGNATISVLEGPMEKVINRLIYPQSVAIVYSSDDAGNKTISKVDLLPTGKVDARFAPNPDDGAAPLQGSQEQLENRLLHNERRAQNRARKIEQGSLVWTPEGQQKLQEKQQKAIQHDPSQH